MDFPTAADILAEYNIVLFSGPLFVGLGAWLLWRPAAANSAARGRRMAAPRWLVASAMLVVGCFHLLAYTNVLSDLKYRSLEPAAITEVEIRPLAGDEGKPAGTLVRVANPKEVRRGFRMLEQSSSYFVNHEHFSDGYAVFARTPGRSYTFSVFSKTHRGSQTASVGVVELASGHTYCCPEFVGWVKTVYAAGTKRRAPRHRPG